ncbi:MAG: carboxypeptidase-like regulatory domain-containing protein [Candidatus Thiodiazotropha endolucinida]|nr:carboxypeptidase-like regulatory domain-containing protein [Candidatus Thiodiazotropha endolucinida]
MAKNPYFAKVAEDGTFSIGDVPPGSYTIKAWHGMLKNKKAKVKVEAGGTATVDFTFK